MRLFIVVSMLLWNLGMQAQTSEKPGAETGRSAVADKFSSLVFSFDYASNSDIIGKYSEIIDQPSFSASFSYLGKSGIDASAIGFLIGNSDDSLENYSGEIDIMLGYNIRLFNYLMVYPSYSHFFYSKKSNALQTLFTDELHVDLDFNYKFLDIGVTPGFYLGKQSTFYTTLRNFYAIHFNNVIFKNTLLSIQPGFDMNFGDFEYLNRFYLNELKEINYFYEYLLMSREIRHYVYIQKTMHPELTIIEILDKYLNERIEDKFKLTSAFIYLPISYIAGNFSFNLGLYAFTPIKQPDYLYNDMQLFINMGISYNLVF